LVSRYGDAGQTFLFFAMCSHGVAARPSPLS